MISKKFWLRLSIGTLLILLFLVGCYTPPPVRPNVSQTVITIQRYPSRIDAKKQMEVYIDDKKNQYTIGDGLSVSIPVNDGVHFIYVQVGKNKSETLNFTAAQKTVSFIASVEGGAFKKTKVVLSRGNVIDDTGSLTDKETQEAFTPR